MGYKLYFADKLTDFVIDNDYQPLVVVSTAILDERASLIASLLELGFDLIGVNITRDGQLEGADSRKNIMEDEGIGVLELENNFDTPHELLAAFYSII